MKKITFSDYLVLNNVDNDSTFPPQVCIAMTHSTHRPTKACKLFHSK